MIRLAPPAVSLLSALVSGRLGQDLLSNLSLGDLLAPKLEYRWTSQ